MYTLRFFIKVKRAATRDYFPDLACCEAKGETLDEAVENANEAALDWINLELSEDEVNLPPVSEVSDLDAERRRHCKKYPGDHQIHGRLGRINNTLLPGLGSRSDLRSDLA